MKRILVILVVLAAVAAAVPSAATAAKVKHRGNLIGAGTPVTLTVIKNGGTATKIRGFALRNVVLNCDGSPDPVQFEFLKAFGAIRVVNGKRFGVRLQQRDGAGSMRVTGVVRKRGNRTRGTVKATLTGTQFGTCRLAKTGFRTKRA